MTFDPLAIDPLLDYVRASVPDVTVSRGPVLLRTDPMPGEMTHTVGCAQGTVDRFWEKWETQWKPVNVPLDIAGDLSGRPQAWIDVSAGDWRGPTRWHISVLAFIEEEARQACEAVADAVLTFASRNVSTPARLIGN